MATRSTTFHICRSALAIILALAVIFHTAALRADPESAIKFGIENERRDPITALAIVFNPINTIAGSSVLNHLGYPLDYHVSPILYFGSVATLLVSVLGPVVYTVISSLALRANLRLQKQPFSIDGAGHIIDPQTGLWLKLEPDIYVVEYKSKPSTVGDYRKSRRLLDTVMFNRAANGGLGEAWFGGSGHIHIDKESAFGMDHQLFRDFIVDLLNHPAIYRGPWTRDRVTATDPRWDDGNLREVIADYDAGDLRSVKELTVALIDAGLKRGVFTGAAVNLDTPNTNNETVELRFLRAQKNSDETINFLSLFAARIEYLKSHPRPKLKPVRFLQKPSAKYLELKSFVEESGLEWAPYKTMLPRWWRFLAEPRSQKRCVEAYLPLR